MRKWGRWRGGYGVMGLCDYGIMGLWGYGVMGIKWILFLIIQVIFLLNSLCLFNF